MSTPLIIAHRGASAIAPENTLVAFREAVAIGADGVEFDVRLAADGVPVVVHDATLLRTAGIDRRVADLTADQLSRIDVGSWFNHANREHARSEFAREGISSLGSVLKVVEKITGPIYIELKCENGDDLSFIVEAVCRELADSTVSDRVIVKSFRLEVIPRVKAVVSGVQTAALFAPKFMRVLRKEKYLIDIAREVGADHLSVHKALVNRKLARKADKHGMRITVWTVDTERWVPRAVKRGLFALITNDPAKLLRRRASMLPRQASGEMQTLIDRDPRRAE